MCEGGEGIFNISHILNLGKVRRKEKEKKMQRKNTQYTSTFFELNSYHGSESLGRTKEYQTRSSQACNLQLLDRRITFEAFAAPPEYYFSHSYYQPTILYCIWRFLTIPYRRLTIDKG